MIIANTAKELIAIVVTASNGAFYDSGQVTASIYLESGDADAGKFWDMNDDTWQASPTIWPTGSHKGAGQWSFTLPATASNGREGQYIHYTMSDFTASSLVSTMCGGGEHYISLEDPLVTSDIPSAATITDAVWDEATSGHVGAGSTGLALLNASGNLTNIANMVSGSVWDADLTKHQIADSAGKYLTDASGNLDDIADAVWDEVVTAHVINDSAGVVLLNASGNLTDIGNFVSASVWDANITKHQSTDSAGLYLSNASGNLTGIADIVWDEPTSGHVSAGSTGLALLNASGNLTDIANMVSGSVWDALRENYITDATMGQTMQFSSSYIDAAITTRSTGTLTSNVYESEPIV